MGPSADIAGQRTLASVLADSDATISIRITDTSVDAIEARYLALVRLLELARAWEERRTGSPVRLAWKRQGATNTAYWTVTGIPQSPRPVGKQGWLDRETLTNRLDLVLTLTLEPVAHAATADTLQAATAFTTVYGSDVISPFAMTAGDVDGPISVAVTKTSAGNDWTTVWLAQTVGTPDFTDYSGTVEAGTLNGQCQQATYTSPTLVTLTGSGYVINTSQQQPIRGILRIKVTAGTANKLQARMRINLGTGTGTQWLGQWVTYAGASGSYYLMDLGAIPPLTNLQNRMNQSAANYFVTIEIQTSDASSVTIRADYATFFAYIGMTKLTAISLANGDSVYYEDIYQANSGAYMAPRQDTQAYEAVGGTLQANATRQGRLARFPGGATVSMWVAAQSATAHLIADTGTIAFKHLACYSSGLRGAS